jgi:hypothetical protein
MIAATRHLINVDEELRDQWFDCWRRAQQIYRTAAQEADDDARSKLVRKLMGDKVPSGSTRLDLRDLHSQLERTAKSALEIAPER